MAKLCFYHPEISCPSGLGLFLLIFGEKLGTFLELAGLGVVERHVM